MLCQKQNPNATARTAAHTISLLTKLVEMIDDAQAILVADRPKALRHLTTRPPRLGGVLRIRRR